MSKGAQTDTQTQPEVWQNLINASLEEGHIDGALTQLQNLLIDNVAPSIQHTQLLAYLALNPEIENPNAQTSRHAGSSKRPTEMHQLKALQLLYQLLSTVKPMFISGAFPNTINYTACVGYDVHNSLQKIVRSSFTGRESGIWDLLLVPGARTDDMDSDDEYEGFRAVHDDAWDFIQWLVKLWESDPAGATFLRQLPPGLKQQTSSNVTYGEQYDCSLPMNIVMAACAETGDAAETIKRRDVAAGILKLLHRATIIQPKPLFSAVSLRQYLHKLLRELAAGPIENLQSFLSFFRGLPWIFVADVLSRFLHKDDSRSTTKTVPSGEADGPYAAPTASYFLLAILPSQAPSIPRLASNTIKLALFTLLKPKVPKAEWDAAEPDADWRCRISATFEPEGKEDAKRMEGLKKTIEILLSTLYPGEVDDLDLDTERELIESSLLPAESLDSESMGRQVLLTVKSTDSVVQIVVTVLPGYPERQAVEVEVRSDGMGREEQSDRQQWTEELMASHWEEAVDSGYPIYHMLSGYFLPLLAPTEEDPPELVRQPSTQTLETDTLHHVLFTSHHLIAPSKRKDLKALSSSLNLKGFGKIGYPGIIFAEGSEQDLEDFVREVKSWQWLALRLRVFESDPEGGPRGKGRGEWTELDKLGEAVEWLRGIGKERLLLDFGMGSG